MGFSQKITDAMNNYSRSVTRQQMDEAPPELKYVYIGPVDEKTRPFCLEAAGAGPLTLDEINSLGGEWVESLSSGGGINCRHNWELASSDIKSQFHNGEEAQNIIKQNKEKDKKLSILSPKMAGKHNKLSDAKKWSEKNIAKTVRFDKNDINIDDYNNLNKLTYETIKKYDLPLLDTIGWQTEVYKKTKNVAFLVRNLRTGTSELAFNKTAIKTWKKTYAKYSMIYKTTGRKWGVDHLSLNSVVRHEIGHHLYYSKKGLIASWRTELQSLRKKLGGRKYFELNKKVSEYAASNPSELFAETHSAVMMGLSRNVPLEILSIYNKVLGQ
jgi:hypothetical protein